MQMLADWAGPQGWAWKAGFQFRAMNLVEETVRVWGRVTGKREGTEFGLIDIELGIVNNDGKESTPGTATVALPYKNGSAIPYAFVPPKL
jgi:acyl dehydratase